MKKFLTFVLMFCSFGVFAQSSCTLSSKDIASISLTHYVDYSGTELSTGKIFLVAGSSIVIDDFTSWCNCKVGEPASIFTPATMPKNCVLCLYQKATTAGLECGCKCSTNNGVFSCYKPAKNY